MASTPQSSPVRSANRTPALASPPWLRPLLAACILLAPLSITLYLVAWTSSGRDPLAAAAAAGATRNTLRLIGAVAASFFLPLGYLAMSLLGMRRMPGDHLCGALARRLDSMGRAHRPRRPGDHN